MRFLMTQLFGGAYTRWYWRHRCGAVLLTSTVSRGGLELPGGSLIPSGVIGLKGISAAVAAVGLILLGTAGWVPALPFGVVAVGLFVASVWPEKVGFEMRDLAVLVHSDLSHVDERHGPTVIDYEWIDDLRWDEQDRLVLALSEHGTLMTSLRFARTEVAEPHRRDATRILWQRIGKSRRELAAPRPS